MKIPTADQLLVYILETAIAMRALAAMDLPAPCSSLEYKLKGDVTLFVAMYGLDPIAPYWSSIAEGCWLLYDMKLQPASVAQVNPVDALIDLRLLIRRRSDA